MSTPILAFDVGGTQGRCGLATTDGKLGNTAKLQRPAGDDGRAWLDRLLAAGTELTASAKVQAVSVSFGGPVADGRRVLSMHVSGWENVDLYQALAENFRVPVFIENDANCGALGEFTYGAGRGTLAMAYFTVSTGIGGGVILDGKLYRGSHGLAAEFGHMVMHPGPEAPQYAAGKPGVLEALSSGPAIAREGRDALRQAGRPAPDNLTARDVFSAAARNEPWACGVVAIAIGHLARGVAAALCAYDVERVVVGGGVALAGDGLFVPLRTAVERYLPHYLERKADILPAALGDNSALLGAVALAAEKLR